MFCTLPNHDACSLKTVARFSDTVVVNELVEDDVLIYGTSDPTINPIELLATAEVVKKFSLRVWKFFNYPLAEPWVKQDKEIIFGPYGFPYDPWEAARLIVGSDLFVRMKGTSIQKAIDEKMESMTLGELAELIKDFRQKRNFVILNCINGDFSQKRVYASRKDKLFQRQFRGLTLREVVEEGRWKLGGTVIYFLFGYYAAKEGLVSLLPHNVLGEVWSAFVAGVVLAGKKVRLFPVSGVDMMTKKQWQLFQNDRRWRKAPVESALALQKHNFMKDFLRRLWEVSYCGIVHDIENNNFYFI